mgnify:CR=1 FL=1
MYKIIILPHFKKEVKAYFKKYHHLKAAVITALERFRPEQEALLGNGVYKIRIHSKDIPKGKSKSFRLIVFVIEVDRLLVPISLYFKGDQSTISKKEIDDHLETIVFELHTEQLIN